MSYISADAGSFGTMLQNLLSCDEIQPGSAPSYQLCKLIYLFHPLGLKMAESPIRMAQSQQREIAVPGAPDCVRKQFLDQWRKDAASKVIFQLATLSRIYGIASVGLIEKDAQTTDRIDYASLYKRQIAFSVFDPLNTAGSLVLNQVPTAIDFLKTSGRIRVQGDKFDPSRACVLMNEQPIYLGYTDAAFGYVGRSVYQRALFPLKSFIQSMITDDLVTLKAGVLIAKLKQPGSVVDAMMGAVAAIKRMIIKEAKVGNVINVADGETIETLDLNNLNQAHEGARKHIIENAATAADMPAKLLLQETFAEGFGEGTEDAKHIARYIDRTREELQPPYAFMDQIVQYRAWNPEFYKTVQKDYPDSYQGKSYTQAFYEWRNAFASSWPNLLTEPDSEKAKGESEKLKNVVEVLDKLAGLLDPENKAKLIQWAADNLNDNKTMFPHPLNLNEETLADYEPPPALPQNGDIATPVADALSNVKRLPTLSRA